MPLYEPDSCEQINLKGSVRIKCSWSQIERTSSSIQSTTASFAFKVLSFLMGDENFQIIEIALTFEELEMVRGVLEEDSQ